MKCEEGEENSVFDRMEERECVARNVDGLNHEKIWKINLLVSN